MPHKPFHTERDNEIERLWLLGCSGGVIGQRLKISRSAVLGVVHRRMLPARPHTERFETVNRIPHAPRPKQRFVAPVIVSKPIPKPVTPSEAPESRGLGMLDLGPTNCRWPFGDRNYTFCGAAIKEHSPYCAHHASISSAGTPKVKP